MIFGLIYLGIKIYFEVFTNVTGNRCFKVFRGRRTFYEYFLYPKLMFTPLFRNPSLIKTITEQQTFILINCHHNTTFTIVRF